MESPPFGILPLSEGWDRIYKMGVLPLQQSVEGRGSELWGANKFIMVYDLVFKMCIQRDPYNYSEQIYNHYCEVRSQNKNDHVVIMHGNPGGRSIRIHGRIRAPSGCFAFGLSVS
eukprot:1328419-Amorphochlora_amoeboformis.AAC.4